MFGSSQVENHDDSRAPRARVAHAGIGLARGGEKVTNTSTGQSCAKACDIKHPATLRSKALGWRPASRPAALAGTGQMLALAAAMLRATMASSA